MAQEHKRIDTRAIDVQVAEKLGWKEIMWVKENHSGQMAPQGIAPEGWFKFIAHHPMPVPHFSTKIEDTWKIVGSVDGTWKIEGQEHIGWEANFLPAYADVELRIQYCERPFKALAETICLAMCLSFMKAVLPEFSRP